MNFLSSEFLLGLLLMAVILLPFLYHYYKKYYDHTHDDAKYVVLMDFDSHMKKIGKFISFNPNPTEKVFRINIENSTGEIEEWAILLDTKYSFGSVSRDYGNFLIIWCNFVSTNFENRTIKPLFDLDIIKVGLIHGLKAINDRLNPLHERIENLEKTNKIYQNLLRDLQKKNTLENLNYAVELGEGNNILVEKIRSQFKSVSAMTSVKMGRTQSMNIRGVETEINDHLKTTEATANEIVGRARKGAKVTES